MRNLYSTNISVLLEIGSHICSVGLLELVCKFLDVPENPYKAEQEHVKKCLKQVENQLEEISEREKKACGILQEIIREPQLLYSAKAVEFNFTVEQANVIIESCQKVLAHAQKVVDKLFTTMSIKKGLSRLSRLAGFGVTCYWLYNMSTFTSTMDSLASNVLPTAINLLKEIAHITGLQYVAFPAACAFAGYGWLSLYPSKVYAFQADLRGFKLEHERLKFALDGLEKKLKIHQKYVPKQ